jgi:BirA family biotin operon repressor/biotin-[acetyl-CoA-carboxylase] ligase
VSRPADLPLALLQLLLRQPQARSHHALAQTLGCDAIAVSRAVESLAAQGCQFDHHPQHGVRLLRSSLSLWSDYIQYRHPTGFGHRTLVYQQTDSTQTVAARLAHGAIRAARPADVHGYVITAEHQRRGRGRRGSAWQDTAGDQLLTTTIAHLPGRSVDAIMLGVCIATASAVERVIGRAVQIKWPNDLLIDGGKVGGILVERLDELAMIGIGINVTAAPPVADSRVRSVALADQTRPLPDRLLVLDRLLERMNDCLLGWTLPALADAWRQRATLMQHRVVAEVDGRRLTGRVIDIDPVEGLLLQVEHGPVVALPAATTHIVSW